MTDFYEATLMQYIGALKKKKVNKTETYSTIAHLLLCFLKHSCYICTIFGSPGVLEAAPREFSNATFKYLVSFCLKKNFNVWKKMKD